MRNLFKVSNKDTRIFSEIFSNLTIKALEQCRKLVQSYQLRQYSNVRDLFKIIKKDTGTMSEICSKLTIKTLGHCMKFVQS